MSLVDQYIRRSQEIIGNRTQSEVQYDNEVIKWLKKGVGIRKAISQASKKYPDEALKIDEANVDDVAAHYEYLMQHMDILRRISPKRRKSKTVR